ncbi:SRPBCC family protein [Pseudonocardia pini]|uniref:SRPBCC family protein n=1 Tax=Pseudonocardia pini TaxID=2758030 RepID=UPI0015F05ADE|nr:SRPBCC family protein [Pseudonocardia pini]
MAKAFETEVLIDRPVSDVWRELTDWERGGRWLPGVDTLRREGATLTFHTRGKERTSTITEVVPGTALTLESVQGGVTARYVYRLEPEGEGTRAHLSADVATRGVTTLLGPVIRAAVRRTDSVQLQRLREVVEGAGSR